MKLLVTGSRNWTDRRIVHDALAHLTEADLLVHGANGRYDRDTRTYCGADILCEQLAMVHSIPTRPYPVTEAEWTRYGLSAGPRRNLRMYEEQRPDEVVAFRLPGTSKGTDGMVKIALDGGTGVVLYYLESPDSLMHALPDDWAQYCKLVGRKP